MSESKAQQGHEGSGVHRQMVRLSIPTKIFLGYTLVLGLFSLVLVLNYARLGRLYDEVTIINRGLIPFRLTLSELEGDLQSYLVLLAERDPVVLSRTMIATQVLFPFPRRIEERLVLCRQAIDQLLARTPESPQRDVLERQRRIVQVLGERNDVLDEWSAQLVRVLERGGGEEIEPVRQRLSDTLVGMRAQMAYLSRNTDSIVVTALDWAAQTQRRNVLIVVLTTAGAMVVALMVMLWSAHSLRPLTKLSEGVKALQAGAYETVEVHAANEIGELAREFNQMVTALQERDERLEEAHRTAIQNEQLATIGRLTSQITHEIRNPLSSIALNIEMLEEEIRLGDSAQGELLPILQAITREVDRLTGITEEYLIFARLPAPRKQLESINELVGQVVSFHGEELRQRSIEIGLELADDLPQILMDGGQIRQALLNLVRNAMEAMPLGGHLDLRTRLDGDQVELTVTDQGEGISPEIVGRIFEPFFTTKPRGTGLGLSLARQIASQHEGNLQVRTDRGLGAQFVLRIPIVEPSG
ncbi:MAG: HAMP domain-containing protein [Bradymonadales bacterium]|nr:HAMP domain-containing protein [Bradymonadales bacterium]